MAPTPSPGLVPIQKPGPDQSVSHSLVEYLTENKRIPV
jgi:hypothetical protein